MKSGGTVKLGKFKLSKNAVMMGGAVGVGILAYAYYTRRGSSTPTDSTGTGGSYVDPSIDPNTGMPYSDEFGGGGTSYSGLGIYDPTTGAYLGNGYGSQIVTGVTTNAAWTQAAVAYLVSVGYEGVTVNSAIGKVLSGQAVTQDELNIFNAAVAAEGNPPNGFPAIHMAGSAPGGTTNPPPSGSGNPPPAVTGLKGKGFKEHIDLDWNDMRSKDGKISGYSVWADGVRKGSPFFSTMHVWGVSGKGKSHKMEVAAFKYVNGKQVYGPKTAITVKTV